MKQIEITPGMNWDEVMGQLNGQDVILTRQGHAVALLSDFDDDDLAWYARERDPEFLASIIRAREQAKKGQTMKHEDLKRELEMRP